MNLFVTDMDPIKCAQALDDKRVGKLLMEANQMLSLAIKCHWPEDDNSYVFYETPTELTSGFAHRNHPVSMWVRETDENFLWTFEHALALGYEYEHRFGVRHASSLRTANIAVHVDCLPAGPLLPFQNSARNAGVGIDFTHLDVPYSYREYLNARWKGDTRPVTFTNRMPPEWSSLW